MKKAIYNLMMAIVLCISANSCMEIPEPPKAEKPSIVSFEAVDVWETGIKVKGVIKNISDVKEYSIEYSYNSDMSNASEMDLVTDSIGGVMNVYAQHNNLTPNQTVYFRLTVYYGGNGAKVTDQISETTLKAESDLEGPDVTVDPWGNQQGGNINN